MAINLNSNISILAPFNLDAKYGVWSGADLATAKASALAGIPSIYRAIGMTVGLYFGGTTTEYWFKDGVADGNLVQKTSGGTTVSGGNLISVSSGGQVNFSGGANTGGNIIVQNTNGNNFSFRSNDGVNAGLTVLGDSINSKAIIALNGTGQASIQLKNSTFLGLTSDAFSSNATFAYFAPQNFGVSNAWDFLNYGKGIFGSDEASTTSILNTIGYASGGETQLSVIGYDTDAKMNFEPNQSGLLGDFYSYINNNAGNGLVFQFAGTNQAFFSSNNQFVYRGSILAGADSVTIDTPLGIIESRQTGNTTPNLKLSGKTTGDKATLQFSPNATSDGSFIDYTKQLHFAYQGTEVARFGANTTAAFIQYFNMCVGYGSGGTSPSDASLDVYRTNLGGQEANIKLRGKLAGDNARLDFVPFAGSDGVINNSTNTKIFFWTNGSGTSYYDAGLFYFGTNLVQINNVLSTNQSSLLINPSYTSTNNSAITISGSSIRTSTRGISIVSSYTGASSHAFFVGSSVSASGNLAISGNIAPTLIATANNDFLIAKDINPTFSLSSFTGVTSVALRTVSGSNLFNTLSGNTIIGSGGDSGNFKLDVYGTLRATTTTNTNIATASVSGLDATFGINVQNTRSAGSKITYGGYFYNLGFPTSGANGFSYGVYGVSIAGFVNTGGYFEANGNNSASRVHIGVQSVATNYNGTSTVSGIGGFFQVSTSITSGTAIPIIGNVVADSAPTGTLKYIDLRNAGTSQFFVERNANRNRPAMMIGGTTINDSAIIQADSTTQGFLPPRMTGAQAVAISSPATGLMVYATASGGAITTAGWWGYNGATWVQLG